MRRLEHAVVVITGAASGIGRATALALARRGCALALADRDAAGLAEARAEIAAIAPTIACTTHVVDVANAAAMTALAQAVIAAHAEVNVVINNAGVCINAKFEDHGLDDFAWLLGVNLWGVIHGCHVFLPHLRRARFASIVNVSSMFGLTGMAMQSAYCASKFAVRGLSEALAVELAPDDIDVICVHPGGIRTNIAANSRSVPERARETAQAFFDRFGTAPEHAAAAIVEGLERRRQRVLITPEARLTDLLKRLYPPIPRRLVRHARRFTDLL